MFDNTLLRINLGISILPSVVIFFFPIKSVCPRHSLPTFSSALSTLKCPCPQVGGEHMGPPPIYPFRLEQTFAKWIFGHPQCVFGHVTCNSVISIPGNFWDQIAQSGTIVPHRGCRRIGPKTKCPTLIVTYDWKFLEKLDKMTFAFPTYATNKCFLKHFWPFSVLNEFRGKWPNSDRNVLLDGLGIKSVLAISVSSFRDFVTIFARFGTTEMAKAWL